MEQEISGISKFPEKKDNLVRWTEIFETNFREMSVPFDFEPGFPEILVEWNAPYIWKHILGAKTSSLPENIPEEETDKEDTEKVLRTFWKRNWALSMLQMLKYSEFIV